VLERSHTGQQGGNTKSSSCRPGNIRRDASADAKGMHLGGCHAVPRLLAQWAPRNDFALVRDHTSIPAKEWS
jgi:hypothetical protein